LKLKFASYNIHKAVGSDGRRDADRILRVIHELGADVIALQEVDLRFGSRASVLPRALVEEQGYAIDSLFMRPESMGWHGNAVLVRRAIDILDAAPIALPTLEPRGAVRVELSHGGTRFRVAGMHLDLSGLRRGRQLRSVIDDLETCAPACPCVILGDFNEWSLRGGSMRALGPGWQVIAPGKSFPSRRPLAPLDRIAFSKAWRCPESGVHRSALAVGASDHLPVWAELELLPEF
jgi:endonuclease/exonuclease/phosphatase family metal-dependent hydrolase